MGVDRRAKPITRREKSSFARIVRFIEGGNRGRSRVNTRRRCCNSELKGIWSEGEINFDNYEYKIE